MRNSDLLNVTELTQILGFSAASKASLPHAIKVFEKRLEEASSEEEAELCFMALDALDGAKNAFDAFETAKKSAATAISHARQYRIYSKKITKDSKR